MTFSYNPAAADKRNDVRLLIGDVDESANVSLRLEDEDIDRLITLLGGNVYRVGAQAARILAGKFARQAEGSTGPDTIRPYLNNRAGELRRLADQLEGLAAAGAAPFAGGLSISGRQSAKGDTDRVEPVFERGMLDHPDGVDFTEGS